MRTVTYLNDKRGAPSLHKGWLRALTHTALNAVTSPLLAVKSDGGLLFGNRSAHSLLRESRWLQMRRGRVMASADSDSNPPLSAAIALLSGGIGSTVLLTSRHSSEQAVATVAPIAFGPATGRAGSVSVGLLWLATGELEHAAVQQVSRLFNLTHTEERILAQLAGGADVREAAARHQVSIHTVRNQLKSILHKTGRHSQAQLLALVVRMASLQSPDIRPGRRP